MSQSKGIKGTARGSGVPQERVSGAGQGQYSGDEARSVRGSIMARVAEIGKQERVEANARQKKAGIEHACKHGFDQSIQSELLKAALDKLWRAGPHARDLYVKLGKGLACMAERDVIVMAKELTIEQIEAIAPDLAAGKTLKEAQ